MMMIKNGGLTDEQLHLLADRFQLDVLRTGPLSPGFVRPTELLDRKRCASYLDELGDALGSPNRRITASLFAKRYAFLVAAPSLYAMTMYNKALDMSLCNCRMESERPSRTWPIRLKLDAISALEPAAEEAFPEARRSWRDEAIRGLFAEHLGALWRVLHETSRVPLAVLWENTAVRVFSLYEKRMDGGDDDRLRLRIADDYEYLVHQAPGHLFGEKLNPLGKYDRPFRSHVSFDKPIRIRQTCCFYYEVDADKSFCSNCPRLYREQEGQA